VSRFDLGLQVASLGQAAVNDVASESEQSINSQFITRQVWHWLENSLSIGSVVPFGKVDLSLMLPRVHFYKRRL
jgi:hypothetical protein